MRKLLSLTALSAVMVVAGCENRVTTADVAEQRQEVDSLNREVQELQSSKESRAAQAAEQARADVDAAIDDKKEELADEQQQLAALQQRQAFEDDMRAKLQSLETRIDQLEEHAASAKGEDEVRLREQIAALQTRRDQLKRQLDEMEAASGDAWGTMKIGVENTWKEAEAGMRDLIHDASNPNSSTPSDQVPPPAPTSPGATDSPPKDVDPAG